MRSAHSVRRIGFIEFLHDGLDSITAIPVIAFSVAQYKIEPRRRKDREEDIKRIGVLRAFAVFLSSRVDCICSGEIYDNPPYVLLTEAYML